MKIGPEFLSRTSPAEKGALETYTETLERAKDRVTQDMVKHGYTTYNITHSPSGITEYRNTTMKLPYRDGNKVFEVVLLSEWTGRNDASPTDEYEFRQITMGLDITAFEELEQKIVGRNGDITTRTVPSYRDSMHIRRTLYDTSTPSVHRFPDIINKPHDLTDEDRLGTGGSIQEREKLLKALLKADVDSEQIQADYDAEEKKEKPKGRIANVVFWNKNRPQAVHRLMALLPGYNK